MVAPAKSLIASDEIHPFINLSDTCGENGVIFELVPSRLRVCGDALKDLSASACETNPLPLPTHIIQDVPPQQPVTRLGFTDPPVLLEHCKREAEVAQVRALLSGGVILIVGGDCRTEAARRLEEAFDCPVRWQEMAPYTSLDILEPAITDEIAMVLLLIRWSSHAYQELAQTCKAWGALVRILGGYNPTRVAHDVLVQAGTRLNIFSKLTTVAERSTAKSAKASRTQLE